MLGMGRAGSRMAFPLFGSFGSGGVSVSASVVSIIIKPNCVGPHVGAQVARLTEALAALVAEVLPLPRQRSQHPCGVHHSAGCTPVLVESSQLVWAVVLEEAQDVSWLLRRHCRRLLLHIPTAL